MDEEMIIRVVAPATLEEGFSFDILLEGRPISVTVPTGGVSEGEEFEVPYPQELLEEQQLLHLDYKNNQHGYFMGQDEEEEAPHGQFRVSLCSCCDVITQSTFWTGCFCVPVLLAQLLTRLGLKWNGREIEKQSENFGERRNERRFRDPQMERSMTFNRIIMAFIGALVLGYIPVLGGLIVITFYIVTTVWIGGNLRRHVRQRYEIPNNCSLLPGSFEDRCIMCCCGCCAAIQVARHTHDDKEYPGACCTVTGL
ncbi:expressed unknown protein [Seminavis robusta]|uniref:Uncharacterized protein n=1 Tax=Seminavis robusta TaxID=568900 RepID=A0A9N8HCK0_9STRA|nr:expressed unknown protein [Seminavis robusta]|eukprot:Sro413_g138070.1 n/a (254) ;mRNA; f:31107-31868